jgi:hypothetical protein
LRVRVSPWASDALSFTWLAMLHERFRIIDHELAVARIQRKCMAHPAERGIRVAARPRVETEKPLAR